MIYKYTAVRLYYGIMALILFHCILQKNKHFGYCYFFKWNKCFEENYIYFFWRPLILQNIISSERCESENLYYLLVILLII